MPTSYYVFSGVTSSGIALNAGDALFVFSGGTTIKATVNSGGFEAVSSGGLSISTTVNSGGFEAVSAGGWASSTLVKSGGTTFVYSGGVTLKTTVSSGAAEIVASAGTASGTVVNPGGTLVILPGARQSSTTGTVISSGVVLYQPNSAVVAGQNSATGATVNNGGVQYVLTSGTVSNTTVGNSGTQNVFFGGKATSTTVNSGGFEAVSAGGIAIGTTVNNGGYELVTGGTATGTTVNSGGYEFVSSGGRTVSTTVNNGGFQMLSGGTTVSATLNNGGQQFVLANGTASSTIVNIGGFDWVFSGGTAISATLNSGGVAYVSSGGTAIGATVNGGGSAYIFSGGVANLTVVNSGGIETVYSGGVASSTAINAGGTVDLPWFGFSGGGSAVANASTGVLTITEGSASTRLSLSGNYTHETFLLAADSGGGTQVIAIAAPTISCSLGGQQTIGAAQISPFGNVIVADTNPGQTETVTVTLSSAANGILSNLGGGVYNAATGIYSLSGTIPVINAALDGLVFTPTLGKVAPGQSVTTTFTINDADTAGASTSDSATTVIATVAPAPIISGTQANASAGVRANLIVNGGFEGGVYSNTAQPAPFIAPITNSAVPIGWTPVPGFDIATRNGVVSSNPRSGNNDLQMGNNLTDAPASISQQITTVSGIVYQLTFYIANVAYAGTFQVLVDGIQDVAVSAQAPSFGATTIPFVASFADGRAVTVNPVQGQYSLVTFDFVGTGTDTIALAGANNSQSYTVDDVAVTALPVLYANQSIVPFAQVSVTDPNANQAEIITVTPSNPANGVLFDPNAANDGSSVNSATGVWTVTGSTSAVTADLATLVFRPNGQSGPPGRHLTTWFTISDTDTAGTTVTDSTTSVVATAETLIQTDNGTSLVQAGLNYCLNNSNATGPILQYGGSPVTVGEFGAYAPVVATALSAGGYEVAFKNAGASLISVWTTDANGNFTGCPTGGGVSPANPALELLEPGFNQDLNSDGTIGLKPTTVIQIDNGTTLISVGNEYVLEGSNATGPILQYGGSPVTVGEFGAYAPVVATALPAGGYEVALKNAGAALISVWTTDANGNFTGCPSGGGISGTNPVLELLEAGFHQDLNNDGTIGLKATPVIQIDNGTTLISVGNEYVLEGSNATGPILQYGGSPVTVGEFGAYAPIGATALSAGGYEVAFKNAGASLISVWTTDANGNFTGSPTGGGVSPANPALELLEPGFHQDLNSDGTIGLKPTTVIQIDNGTTLISVGNEYVLEGSNATGPILQYGGSPVTVGEFGAYAPVVATALPAGGYEVALKNAGASLMSVWTTDANGNFTGCPSGGGISGTNPVLELLEADFHQDLNSDGTIGLKPTPVIQIDNGTTLISVGNEYVLEGSNATGPILQYGGSPVTVGEFGAYAPIGATALPAGGYEVAFKNAGASLISVWTTDANGNFTGSPTGGGVSPANPALELLEPGFHQDLNSDGTIGLKATTVIQIDNGTTLISVGNEYVLEGSNATGPILQYGGSPVTVGEFGAYAPVVATALSAGGYEVAFKNAGASLISVWTTDANGNFTGSPTGGGVSPANPALELLEPGFHQDLNSDGTIGLNPTSVIQIDNGTTLIAVGNEYVLEGSNATGPILQYGGSPVTVGELGAYAPVVATALPAGGYEVALKNAGASLMSVWTTDASGNFTGSPSRGGISGTNPVLELLEADFHQDLNNDGTIGLKATPVIQIDNGTTLISVGNEYVLEGSNATGPILQYGGSPVTVGEFGAYAPIGATALPAGGYEVAFKNAGASLISVWTTDANGNFTGSPTGGGVSTANPVLELLEADFHQDLNSDGTIGLKPTTVIQIDNGTTLISVGNEYVLEGSNATGPILQYGGSPVTVGEFGAYAPVVATALSAGGYEVAFKNAGASLISVWTTDANGNFTGSPTGGGVSPANPALELLEPGFHQDLNSDGTIGLNPTSVIQIDNGTTLIAVGNEYVLEGSNATGPILQYGGSPVTVGEFGAYAPVVATALPAGGYEVALKNAGASLMSVWTTDANGNFTGSPSRGGISGTNPVLELLEADFHQDLNNDGTIGLRATPVIQIDNGTTLISVGNEYVLEGSNATGPILQYGGSPVTVGEFGAYAPIGATALPAGGYEVAFKNAGASLISVWTTDANGNFTGSPTGGGVSTANPVLELLEAGFNQDLNSDGTIGLKATSVIQIDNGTTLISVGNEYVLEGSNATGPILQYGGNPVTAGEFGSWTPIGAVQQNGGGSLVAWSMPAANQYVVWRIDSNGNYTGGATGAVAGTDFTLEQLETTFNQDLNGNGRLSSVVDTGTSGGDSLILTGQTQVATINLGGNTAFVSAGLSAPALTFIGTPDAITLGAAAATIQYTLGSASGIETIANFSYGLDLLNIDLAGAASGSLQAYNTTVGGQHAIAIAGGTDPTHDVVLLNMPTGNTAANLLSSHTTFNGGHALII